MSQPNLNLLNDSGNESINKNVFESVIVCEKEKFFIHGKNNLTGI